MNTTQSTCPICKSDNLKEVYDAREMYYGLRKVFQYAECPDCDALFILNPPDDMSEFYPENYHCHSAHESKFSIKQFLTIQRDRSVMTKSGLLGKAISFFKSSPTIYQTLSQLNLSLESAILDVGCGGGRLLQELKHIGFKNLTGIDPYLPDTLATTQNRFSLIKTSLMELNHSYDAIILNHSFEHMFDHEAILLRLKQLLKPDGRVCIRMPLSNSLAWQQYRTDWFQLDAPRHVIIHSEKSFRELSTRCGFEIINTIYDSDSKQFLRSEIYKQGTSSNEFINAHNGRYTDFITEDHIQQHENLTLQVNKTGKGDQASFILIQSR